MKDTKIIVSIGQQTYNIGSLGNWVTFQQYVLMFGLNSVNIIYNWISRGVVGNCDWVEIPQLNIKIIKAKSYGNKKAGRPKKTVL